MKNWLTGFAGFACVVGLAGCFDMVRRPQPGTPGDWEPSVRDTISAEVPTGQRSALDHPSSLPPEAATNATPSDFDIQQDLREPPSKEARERVRRVNAYALWCIEQGMWAEARSHLERALMQDSLAASLHNNLAIVNEYYGNIQKAMELYLRAIALAADGDPYRQNLNRLEHHQQAAVDTHAVPDKVEPLIEHPEPRRTQPVPNTR